MKNFVFNSSAFSLFCLHKYQAVLILTIEEGKEKKEKKEKGEKKGEGGEKISVKVIIMVCRFYMSQSKNNGSQIFWLVKSYS